MANEVLEAKVKLSGTEEAVTEFSQSQQRMIAATETLSGSQDVRAKTEVEQILTEAGLGPIQQIRQYTHRYERELADLLKSFKTGHDALKKKMPKQKPPLMDRIFAKVDKQLAELGVKPDAFVGDLGRAAGNIMSLFTPTVGGIGGFVGLLLYGVMKDQEWKAQANRFQQIFEESIRGVGGKIEATDRSAAARLSGVAKDLELRFAATRGEIESVAHTFATAGIAPGEIAGKLANAVGAEQRDLFGLTLSLERHFELAGGSVAKQATDLMRDYGMNVQETADQITTLNFAGAKSGIGIANFTNSVLQATSGVRMLGINVDDVAALTLKLQAQYERLGLGKHFAGASAMQGIQQALSGIASFGVGEHVMLAERLGMGKGLEAGQRLLTQLMQEGGASPELLARTVTELRSWAMEMAHGDPTKARFILEQKLGFQGAKAVMDIGDKLAGGLTLDKMTTAQKKQLADAFKTEEQKTGEFQRATTDILTGMAEIGMALFNVVTAGIADIIIGLKFFSAMLSGDLEAAGAYMRIREEIRDVFPAAMEQATHGLGLLGEAAKEVDIEGINLLAKAMRSEGGAEPVPPPAEPFSMTPPETIQKVTRQNRLASRRALEAEAQTGLSPAAAAAPAAAPAAATPAAAGPLALEWTGDVAGMDSAVTAAERHTAVRTGTAPANRR